MNSLTTRFHPLIAHPKSGIVIPPDHSRRETMKMLHFQEVFPCFVLFIFLFTVTLPYYFNPYFWTKETFSFPVPQLAENFIEDVWHRLEVDFRSGNHTLAFLHIQKTGGKEFAIHFQSLQKKGEPLCHLKKRITNYRNRLNSGNCVIDPPQSKEMWLVSETTYGWPCGVHPFLTDFKSCLPNFFKNKFGKRHRSFHYLTLIRHPVVRYISEFYHISSLGNWPYKNHCNGKPYLRNINKSKCMVGIRKNVLLSDFMSCPESWSNNRQTMMLADVDKAECLNQTAMSSEERDSILLATAKWNLKEMMYFGVTEYINESVLLLEHRFDVKIASPLSQPQIKDLTIADLLRKVWSNRTLYNEISSINYLDMQLYEYGLTLFEQRLKQIHINIDLQKTEKDIYNIL